METVVLTIHLILALLLIGVVLLQKSEGAALLSGGGNTQARPKATALTKVTWVLAIAFIITSIALTILATRGTGSVIDGIAAPSAGSETSSGINLDAMMPPPAAAAGDASADPLAPPRADAPASEEAAPTAAPATEAPAEVPAEQKPADSAN